MKRLQSGVLGVLACVVLVSASGCMIGPENHEYIGESDSEMSPAGFVLKGGMLIEVQSYNWGKSRWETVATTRSTNGSWAYEGYNWHYWQASDVQLTQEYWLLSDHNAFEEEGLSYGHAKLRALGDGDPLYTFDEWRLGTIREMANQVNGTEIELEAIVFAPWY